MPKNKQPTLDAKGTRSVSGRKDLYTHPACNRASCVRMAKAYVSGSVAMLADDDVGGPEFQHTVMSSPLAATSLATSTAFSSALKRSRAFSRARCCIPAGAAMPSCSKKADTK